MLIVRGGVLSPIEAKDSILHGRVLLISTVVNVISRLGLLGEGVECSNATMMLVSIHEPTDLVIVTHLLCVRRLTHFTEGEVIEDDLASIPSRDAGSAHIAEVTFRLNVITGIILILASKLQNCTMVNSIRHFESLQRIAVSKASAEKRRALNCVSFNNREALKGRSLDCISHPYLPITIIK